MVDDLRAVYDSEDEIPETVTLEPRSLYTERHGKWELSGIPGLKTQGDVERVRRAKEQEVAAHKETKEKLAAWGDWDREEIASKLDRIPELEAAAAGKLDDDGINQIVEKRLEGAIKSKTGPLTRAIEKLTAERDEAVTRVQDFEAREIRRKVHDDTREALTSAKVLPTAFDDALLLAERVFEITEEGETVTKDGVGVTPGIAPAAWLEEIQEKRPHWWPPSSGGGARGSGTGGIGGGSNPWSADHWNKTEQGRIVQARGVEIARRLASAAGSDLGATAPPVKGKA